MKRMPATTVVAIAIAATAILGASCTSDDGASPGTTSTTVDPIDQIPSSDGDSCTDPTGDIGAVAGKTVEQGTLTEPAGIDLVSGSATVNGTNLDVAFTTSGPIDTVPNTEFLLAQGEPLQPVSFEARATREALGPWTLTYISWETGAEVRKPLATVPVVDGNTLTFSLPLDQLPPIATYLAFGASAEVADGSDADDEPDVVFDDCSSLSSTSSSSSTTGTAG